ncbi:glycosyltransferase [Pseudomonas sp. LP_7_YM]|uniref:glycosyltransferase n=1 Tax=Pseudomonas sp. LP_7_YM TaxID=2485137 RepID=UPI00105FEA82|nr:glycosyltransferase [Pseudomonas sp. LP_7_YM]TDV61889.1 rhamnosyltransferase [Pseudomonas sp. LP_7_YM]
MSFELPEVAVLLAAYNGMPWIEEQLASILAQTNVHVSIYISVDPSTDGTESWCAKYALSHPNVTLLPPVGPFKGAARNFFRLIRDVDFSAYHFVSFSDQDDIWYPDKLERAIATLRSDHIDGYSSNVVAFWPNGRRMLVDKAQPQVQWDYLFEAAGPGCTYVLKPALASGFKQLIVDKWERVQEIALHDWFCYAYARSHGFKWFIDPVPGMDYRQHADNHIGVNSGISSGISRLHRIVDGWWYQQIELTRSLVLKDVKGFLDNSSFIRLRCGQIFQMSRDCRRKRRDQLIFPALYLMAKLFGSSLKKHAV